MAEEPHNLPLSPYHYTNNNPISFIDPDGMDWWVGNQGEMLFLSGQTKLPEDYEQDNWTHFGGDDLFADATNGIETMVMSGEFAESFMGEQGYTKVSSQELVLEETDNIIIDQKGGRLSVTNTREESVIEKYTYTENNNKLVDTRTTEVLENNVYLDLDISTSSSSVSRRSMIYGKESFFNKVLDIMIEIANVQSGNLQPRPLVKRYKSWDDYPRNGRLSKYKKTK